MFITFFGTIVNDVTVKEFLPVVPRTVSGMGEHAFFLTRDAGVHNVIRVSRIWKKENICFDN